MDDDGNETPFVRRTSVAKKTNHQQERGQVDMNISIKPENQLNANSWAG